MQVYYSVSRNYAEVCGYSKQDAASFSGYEINGLLSYDELPVEMKSIIKPRKPMGDYPKGTSNKGMAGYYGRSKSQGWG